MRAITKYRLKNLEMLRSIMINRNYLIFIACFSFLLIFNCNNNPVDWHNDDLIEFESVWQYLKVYSIYQDSSIYEGRIPQNPFLFTHPQEILESAHDTLKNNLYTTYYDEGSEGFYSTAMSKTHSRYVWLDTLTDSTVLLKIETFLFPQVYDQFVSCVSKVEDFPNMIIDLRDNRGGDLDIHESVLEAFLPSGVEYIMARERIYDPHGNPKAYTREWHPWVTKKDSRQTLKNKKFVILIDGYTASASEIFASAMRECKDAVIAGKENSYGKAIGQIRLQRRKRPTIQITYLQLREMGNYDYHRIGLKPDVYIPDSYNENELKLHAVKLLEPSATGLKKASEKKASQIYESMNGFRIISEESLK